MRSLWFALLAIAAPLYGVELKIEQDAGGGPKGWTVKAGDVACIKEDGGITAIQVKPSKAMTCLHHNAPIKISEWDSFVIRAQVKGTGAIRLGTHIYTAKGYLATLPGDIQKVNAPGQYVTLESRISIGTNPACALTEVAEKPSIAFVSVYGLPESSIVIRNIEYAQKKNEPCIPPKLVFPEVIYAVPGVETSIYFDNVFLCLNPGDYAFDVDCGKGRNYERRWSFTPTKGDVGTHDLSLTVIGEDGVVAKGKTKIVVAPEDAGKGKEISLLMVGDSLTDATVYPARLHALMTGVNNPKMKMIGSRCGKDKSVVPGGVAHEGYPGWTWGNFINKFSAQKNGQTVFDLQSFVDKYNNGKMPDFITIQLGVNDVFGATPFNIANTLAEVEKNMDSLIFSFRKAAPEAIIGVGLVTPAARQDAFAVSYRNWQTAWQYKKNQFMLNSLMLKKFQNNSDKKLFLIPTEVNLDCDNNFPTQMEPVNVGNTNMVSRQVNGLHPADAGYNQIGDTYYAWLKYQVSLQK